MTRRFSPVVPCETSASQAENAGSIPVARSKDSHRKPNDFKAFPLTSSDHRCPSLPRVTCPYIPIYARSMPAECLRIQKKKSGDRDKRIVGANLKKQIEESVKVPAIITHHSSFIRQVLLWGGEEGA